MLGRWFVWRQRIGSAGATPWIFLAAVLGLAAVAVALQSDSTPPLPASSHDDVARHLGADALLDTDGDGLPDALENYLYGTDPEAFDTSGDGLPDGWVARWGMDPLEKLAARPMAVPELPPAYGGAWPFVVTIGEVYHFATDIDPTAGDTLGDGIADAWLLHHGLDPRNASLAGARLAGPDGLSVLQAYENMTNPHMLDTDGDGLSDRAELEGKAVWDGRTIFFEPTDPTQWSTAGTGICDGFLVGRGLDPHDPRDALGDLDDDGATTLQEFEWNQARYDDACSRLTGLDPLSATSGTSELPDGWLIHYGLDPFEPGIDERVTSTAPAADPLPAVMLTVASEYRYGMPEGWAGPWWGGTDPSKEDTDGDGLDDALEIQGWMVSVATEPGRGPGQPIRVQSDPTRADADGDGLNDAAEKQAGTHPGRRDTDFDGLDDGIEASLGLDPLAADSIGDGLRDGIRLDLLEHAAARVAAGDAYPFPGPVARTYLDVAKQLDGGPVTSDIAGLAAFFGPHGDLDGDGVTNLLDPDMDGDGLLNGWEVDPRLYVHSPYGTGPLPQGRPATDPMNKDTDGDGLLDGWEVAFGKARFDLGRMDPSPAHYDTDGDGVPDGNEDPDGDSIVWFTFDNGKRTVHEYVHTNLMEQAAGTDPHEASTDDDGLLDGWKVFWGSVYTGPRILATPPPVLGTTQGDIEISNLQTLRWTQRPDVRLEHESPTGQPVRVDDADGSRFLTRLEGSWSFTFLDAQAAQTNPYLPDTDGDGVPDAWEYYVRAVWPRSADDAYGGQCVEGPRPSAVAADAQADADGDGLRLLDEFLAGTDPLCADSDQGGATDGEELAFEGLDPTDPDDDRLLLDEGLDSDGDGVPDFIELRSTPPTDPRNPDTDGDGLLDGGNLGSAQSPLALDDPRTQQMFDLGIAFVRQGDGFVFLGEKGLSSPREADSAGDGIPDGWLVAHGRDPRQAAPASWLACYTYGRPEWWEEPAHGPWWGGGDPLQDDCNGIHLVHDADNDGLGDTNGEDPIPVANQDNVFPAGDPAMAEGLEARYRAQAVVEPSVLLGHRMARAPASGEAPARDAVHFEAVDLSSTDLLRGGTVHATGRVVGADGTGVPGLTVVGEIGSQTFGAATTGNDGAFALPVSLTSSHELPLHDDQVLLGQRGGLRTWTTDPGAAGTGPSLLQLRAYADVAGLHAGTTTELPVHVRAAAKLGVSVADAVVAGRLLSVDITVHDGAGTPLGLPVSVEWGGQTFGPKEAAGGSVSFDLPSSGLVPGSVTLGVDAHGTHDVTGAHWSDTVDVQALARLEVDAPSGDAGDALQIDGRLTTPGGGLAGRQVSLVLTGANGVVGEGETTTDDTGRFEMQLATDPGATGFAHVLRATTDAEAGHTAAAATHLVDLRERPLLLDASAPQLQAQGPRNVTVSLMKSDGPLADRLVRLDLAAQEALTDENGQAVFTVPGPLDVGPLTTTVSFAGDDRLAPATLVRQRLVHADTSIELASGASSPGADVELTARLLDSSNRPVEGQPLTVSWGGQRLPVAVTDEDGRIRLVHALSRDAALGPVVVRVSFVATDVYGAAAATATWNVREASHIELPTEILPIDAPVPPGRLLDGAGQPLRDARVVVHASGDSKEHVTGPDGDFMLVDAPVAGDLAIRITYAGGPGKAPVEVEDVLHFRRPVTLTTPDDIVLILGKTTVVPVEVQSPHGTPAGTVTATLEGQSLDAAAVSDGRARLRLMPDAASGAATLHLQYDGSALDAPASLSVPIEIRAVTQLEVFPGGGDPQVFRIVASTGGWPLAQARLHVMPEGHPSGFTVTTDADGVATFTLPRANQTQALRLTYAGGQGSEPANAAFLLDPRSEAVASGARPWPWFVGAAAAATAAAAAWWLRRRDPVAEAFRRAAREIQASGPYEAEVLAAYARLEDALIDARVLEEPAPTPRSLGESLQRRIRLGPATADLQRLLSVFEQARYGGSELGPAHRDTARDALGAIRRQLMRSGVKWQEAHP